MKILQLFEEFVKSMKVTSEYFGNKYKYVQIFLLTPEHYKEDLNKAYEDSGEAVGRFIADTKNEEVYVFSSDALHDDAIETLKLPYNFDRIIRGYYYKMRDGSFATDEGRARKFPWITKYLRYVSHSSGEF